MTKVGMCQSAHPLLGLHVLTQISRKVGRTDDGNEFSYTSGVITDMQAYIFIHKAFW